MQTLQSATSNLFGRTRVIIPQGMQCNPEYPVNGCGAFDTMRRPELRAEMEKIFQESGRDDFNNGGCVCVFGVEEEERRQKARFEWANFPNPMSHRTLEGFVQREGTAEAYSAAYSFANGKGPSILTLSGDTGAGKSHLGEGIARFAYAQGKTVRYIHAVAFLDSFRDFSDKEITQTSRFARYTNTDLIVLDDLGVERYTEFANEILTYLIESRMNISGQLLITTNLVYDEVADKYGNRIASRLWSRNSGDGCGIVSLTASDYRMAA